MFFSSLWASRIRQQIIIEKNFSKSHVTSTFEEQK